MTTRLADVPRSRMRRMAREPSARAASRVMVRARAGRPARAMCQMSATKAHAAMPALHLPICHSTLPLKITRLTGYCKLCDRPTKDLRAHVTEWPNCIEVKWGGVCGRCRAVTFGQFRYYEWGLLHHCDAGWLAVREDKSRWFWGWFRWLKRYWRRAQGGRNGKA